MKIVITVLLPLDEYWSSNIFKIPIFNLKQRKLLVVSIYRPPDQNLIIFCHPLQVYLIAIVSLTKILS